MSKLISATVGDMAVVLSRAPSHKHYSSADIEWMVLPPVLAGQVYIAEAAHNELGSRAPIACVTWAKVSAEVDARLTAGGSAQQLRLLLDEWASGDIYWLIDMVGVPRGIASALKAVAPSGCEKFRLEFFNEIKGQYAVFQGVGLVGHSLGGGLAGFVGQLYEKQAFVFDTMPFQGALTGATGATGAP